MACDTEEGPCHSVDRTPSPGSRADARPLKVTELNVAVGGRGRHAQEIGKLVLPDGIHTRTFFRIANADASVYRVTQPHIEFRSLVPVAPPFAEFADAPTRDVALRRATSGGPRQRGDRSESGRLSALLRQDVQHATRRLRPPYGTKRRSRPRRDPTGSDPVLDPGSTRDRPQDGRPPPPTRGLEAFATIRRVKVLGAVLSRLSGLVVCHGITFADRGVRFKGKRGATQTMHPSARRSLGRETRLRG